MVPGGSTEGIRKIISNEEFRCSGVNLLCFLVAG
jgi:hypothetical protein